MKTLPIILPAPTIGCMLTRKDAHDSHALLKALPKTGGKDLPEVLCCVKPDGTRTDTPFKVTLMAKQGPYAMVRHGNGRRGNGRPYVVLTRDLTKLS